MSAVEKLARLRRLSRICDPQGSIRAAAIDHPETFAILFDRDLSRVSHEEVVRSKLELIEAMAPHCSALLLDPPTAWGPAVLTGAVPGGVGTISGLEALYYQPEGGDFEPRLRLREGWGPEELVTLGVDVAKLVVFHRADDDPAETVDRVADVVRRCHTVNLPLVVEPLWYWKPGESPTDPDRARRRTESVIAATRLFKQTGADIMKVEFPVDLDRAEPAEAEDACARLHEAADGPWVLLSAGVTFDGFVPQLEMATRAGASGYMAGRAIWGDGVGRHDAARRAEGARVAVERLQRLNAIVAASPHPAYARADHASAVDLGEDWFRQVTS
ncbi:hypothetical protein HJ590_16100 [Naumannella sp. ID2617S]|nr:hypothetical protein [Naumannella sp. ID2617S]